MATHYIKQGCTVPKLTAQFVTVSGPAVLPEGTVVLFRARRRTDPVGFYRINATAQIDDASTGRVSYTFETADTSTPGLLCSEFVSTFGADVQKIPTVGCDYVMITTGI